MHRRLLAMLASLLAALPLAAASQSIALQGVLGSKALLIVDGGAPRAVSPGETHQGVRLISASGGEAVVEAGGKRHTLRVGETQVQLGGGARAGGGGRIVLAAGSGGHFMALGAINGHAIQFLVDTGASAVSLSQSDASRLGVRYREGRPVQMATANGMVGGWVVRLDSVRLGDVEVAGVEAVVTPQPMPFALLGNTFLNRFQMKRENDQMVLERRY